jgi:hypothetical protein
MNVNKAYVPSSTPTYVGEGLATTFRYAEGTISFLINPKLNLRFEVGALVRDEKNSAGDQKTELITVGLRSSFRQLYHDF